MSLLVADKLRKLLEAQPEVVERGVIVGREARNVVIVKTSHGVVRAVNTTVASRTGIPVVIAKIRQEWVVIGLDYFAYLDPPSYHTVPYHAEAHVMGHPDGSDDLVFLPKAQYLPLAVVPTSPPTKQVRICAGTFINLDGRIVDFSERIFDLSPIIGGLSAGTNVLLGINRESELAEVIMPDQAGSVTVPVTFIPLALVRLRPNQTEITWKEIVDVRELPSSRSGLSSLSELGDTCITNPLGGDHLVWDEGTGCWANEPNTLANLSDVNISSPADGHILTWDSVSGKWVNAPDSGTTIALDDLVDVSAGNPQQGDIISWDSNAGLWRNGPVPEMAIVSIDGVSNPGGNVDLVASGAITLIPDDTNNRITIGETHSARTDNPHNTTAAQVGAIVSVDGVSNPGGNVDLVAGTGLTITPDYTNKSVTIGADLNYLDGRYVNVNDDETINGSLEALRFAQSPVSFTFFGQYYVDPYLAADDIVFDILQGRPPTSAELWDGSAWVAIDASAFRTLFRGGGFPGYYAMTSGSGPIRIIWDNMPASFFVKLVIYCSTNGNWLSIKCETSADGTTWTERFTTPIYAVTPGWIMRHGFFDNIGQVPYFRLTFMPTWNTSSPIDLHYVRYFCTYSIFNRLVPFSWDVDRVVSFVQTPKVGSSIMWHAGNDGAGSGLDADKLDGMEPTTSAAANTIARRDGNADLTARVLRSTVATGTAPLAVSSTTTVANLNADMLDGKHASAFVTGQGAGVRRTTTQTIPSNTWTLVSFNTEDWDSDNCWSPSEPTRLYCRTAGIYIISAAVRWVNNGNGIRVTTLRRNGADVRGAIVPNPSPTYATRQDINDILSMSSGDFIELAVLQTSGASLNLEPSNGREIELAMARIG